MTRQEKQLYVDSDAYNRALDGVVTHLCVTRAYSSVIHHQAIELREALRQSNQEEDQNRREMLALKISMNAYQMAAPRTSVSNLALEYIKKNPWQKVSDIWHENRTMLEQQEERLEEEFFDGALDEEELIEKAGMLKFEYDNLEHIGDDYKDMNIFPVPHLN
jgi:hypothetical protein